ncbi:hypothetical protein F4778DRAFT_783564 [Xylariomycetidae sp. FL2044]|nr:hypothetical protein F4778DRAFT_783564 [Xylariomycetidae sp. FL2044]
MPPYRNLMAQKRAANSWTAPMLILLEVTHLETVSKKEIRQGKVTVNFAWRSESSTFNPTLDWMLRIRESHNSHQLRNEWLWGFSLCCIGDSSTEVIPVTAPSGFDSWTGTTGSGDPARGAKNSPRETVLDSDDDDSDNDTDANEYDEVAKTKKNKNLAEENASATKTEFKTESWPEVPGPETEQQTTSRKRKRDAEPNEDEQRVWELIHRLLVSCILKRHKAYRPLLRRVMDKNTEHFAPKHKGAVPLILALFIYPRTSIKNLDLHHDAAVYKRAPKDLRVLDISFNRLLRKDNIVNIVAETTLDELIIWHNPDLSREDVAQASKGRIDKVTTRAGFLTPLKKFAERSCDSIKSLRPYNPAPPTASPLPVKIRQVIWMMLGTTEVDPEAPQPDLAG